MSSNSSQVANYSDRYLVWLRNSILSTSGSSGDIVASRVQTTEPSTVHTINKHYELGSVAPTGATTEPTQVKFLITENLHDSIIDMYFAGVNPTTGSGWYAANLIGQINTAFVAQRNDAGSVIGEMGVGNLRVSDVTYKFVINGSCTVDYTLQGTSGSYYNVQGTFPHPLWGSTSSSSVPGGVHGKDARIFFTAPTASNKGYRLQSFTIKIAYPLEYVKELGTRQMVGTVNTVPDITVDFDLKQADYQPFDIFYGTSNDGGITKINLADPQKVKFFIYVYDPTLAEGASVIKSFRIDNVIPTGTSPTQARVRQTATSRWTLMSTAEDTVGSSGLIISKTAIAS